MKQALMGGIAMFALIIAGLAMLSSSTTAKKLNALTETASSTAATTALTTQKVDAVIDFIQRAIAQEQAAKTPAAPVATPAQ